MNNKFIRIMCLLLVVCMIIPFTACDDNEGDETTTTKREETTTSSGGPSVSVLPKKTFDGEEIHFLSSGGDTNPLWAVQDIYPESGRDNNKPEEGHGFINDAVFLRNQSLEEKHKVKITEEQLATNTQFASTLKKNAKLVPDYHALVLPLRYACTTSASGYFYDLKGSDITYIDLEQAWWDQKMTSNLSIGDRIDFATGDLLTSDNDATFIIMFNKTMHKNLHLDNIYELVQDKKWTIDKMIAMANNAIVDDKSDGKFVYGKDTIGFATTSNVPHCLMYGCGFVSTTKNAYTDVPSYSVNLENFTNMVNPIIELTYYTKYPLMTQNMEKGGSGNVEQNGLSTFGEGRALFYGECLQSVTRLRAHNIDFGVIPYPKLNESQLDYYSNMVGEVGCVVAIPKTTKADRLELTDYMIEAMASASKRQLTPAYYQRSIKGQIQDEESLPMLDLILANRVYDLGYYYGWGDLVLTASTALMNGQTSAPTTFAKLEKAFNTAMEKTLARYGISK